MTELRYVVLDVFADAPLRGNPLAVFLDAARLDPSTMQGLARETNLSETTFVIDPLDADPVRVRIFTPATELRFAGHPTLGTACAIGARTGAGTVRLQTGAGVVPVELRPGGGEMTQPVPTWAPYDDPDALLAALGVGGSRLPVEVYDNGVRHAYAVLGSIAEVAALAPDQQRLSGFGTLGVSACAVDGEGRIRTRVFCPGLGVAEDPATGSAAGPLGVHLARHGVVSFGAPLVVEQGAELGRPSRMRVRVEGAGDDVRSVHVGGDAVEVAEGVFRLG